MNNWNMKRIFCLLTIFFCTLFAFNASAQEERDSPRRGEGISVFLERNKRPTSTACWMPKPTKR